MIKLAPETIQLLRTVKEKRQKTEPKAVSVNRLINTALGFSGRFPVTI
jgi:hypothetical protein